MDKHDQLALMDILCKANSIKRGRFWCPEHLNPGERTCIDLDELSDSALSMRDGYHYTSAGVPDLVWHLYCSRFHLLQMYFSRPYVRSSKLVQE